MQKFALFLLFKAAEFMYVNTDRQINANLRIILYKECNKRDVGLAVVFHNTPLLHTPYKFQIFVELILIWGLF